MQRTRSATADSAMMKSSKAFLPRGGGALVGSIWKRLFLSLSGCAWATRSAMTPSSCMPWAWGRAPRRSHRCVRSCPGVRGCRLVCCAEVPSLCLEDAVDGGDLAPPLFGLALEGLAPFFSQAIIASAPVVLGRSPLALHAASAFHATQRGQQRPRIYAKGAVADLLDPQRDTVAMHRRQSQRLQDQHLQCSLNQICRLVGHKKCSSPLDNQ